MEEKLKEAQEEAKKAVEAINYYSSLHQQILGRIATLEELMKEGKEQED